MVAIASARVLNVVLAVALSGEPPPHQPRGDVLSRLSTSLQLAALLYLTGGITNPFALMFLAPVVIAASTLNLGNTLILARHRLRGGLA